MENEPAKLKLTGFSTRSLHLIAVVAIAGIAAIAAWSMLGAGSVGSYTGQPGNELANAPIEKSSTVPPEQIVSGGPPRDGIPSIDEPKFVSVEEAGRYLQDGDHVIGLNVNGEVRAYPLQILVWHEIVNDEVGGTPVAVTYCPLCFTSQVFTRTVDGQVVEFGTSGKLYNSNLVMYDRTSESLWSQALGAGITGQHAGVELERIPMDVAFWKDWKRLYPDTKVLSVDTGFGRPYGSDPYGNYYTSPDILFPVANKDDRLGPKEIVIGLENAQKTKAYALNAVESEKVVNDRIGEKHVMLVSLEQFMVRAFDRTVNNETLDFEYDPSTNQIEDTKTGSQWNFDGVAVNGPLEGTVLARLAFDEGFWFSWVGFHPDTDLYGAGIY